MIYINNLTYHVYLPLVVISYRDRTIVPEIHKQLCCYIELIVFNTWQWSSRLSMFGPLKKGLLSERVVKFLFCQFMRSGCSYVAWLQLSTKLKKREKTKLVAHAKLITFLTNQLHGTQFKSWLSTSKDVTKVFTASCALTITKRRNTEIHSWACIP